MLAPVKMDQIELTHLFSLMGLTMNQELMLNASYHVFFFFNTKQLLALETQKMSTETSAPHEVYYPGCALLVLMASCPQFGTETSRVGIHLS